MEGILDGAGLLLTVVPVIVAAGETPRGKPAPDPYATAVEQMLARHSGRVPRSVARRGHRGLAYGLAEGAICRVAHGGRRDQLSARRPH